ncbi:hypothetical protein E1B28_004335 [Marasmius oreades]|uniref:H/ACA ribonucleoprotein complex subunit 2 n=1 Tax=Marasmius oreades TaxID=181124 RepID=A0A9P7UYB3_9AGAR|nr:uncharacterized protein E1B28_004335 [Marasmius oreades]KAG7096936.1 hypothetical protein E1B28_004335 [Marasmius oreades]
MAKTKKDPKDAAEATADIEMVDIEEKVIFQLSNAQSELERANFQSPKKSKKETTEIIIPIEDLSPLAKPLAQKKLLKKLNKTIKKASKARQIKRGVKEVVKGIRKGEKGLLILAADISPIDIISHLPVLSEEAGVPYVFVSSKEELGYASSTKRPTSCVMICPDQKKKAKRKEGKDDKEDDYKDLYEECYREVEKMDTQIVF